MTSKTALVTLYGNVGGDPEVHQIPGKPMTKKVYDPIIDDLVERDFTTSDREVRTFSIAVSAADDGGDRVTRWIRCIDWLGLSKLIRKGDRLRVKGYFRHRRYVAKDGETKSVRELVLQDLGIERQKIREQVA
jgi:single-stranded DNA-binding protein